MDCNRFETLLDQYLDGTLANGALREAEEHLADCPACRLRLKVLEDCRELNDDGEVPAAFGLGWRQKLHEQEAPKPVKQFPGITRWLAAAAVLILVFGGTWLAGRERRDAAVSAPGQAGYKAYSVEEGGGVYGGAADMAAAPRSAESNVMAEASPAKSDDAARQKIIRTARLELSTRAFDADYAAMLAALDKAGGRVQNTSLSLNYDGMRVLYLTLRVPAGRLDGLAGAVKGIGRLVSFSESADDVSEQYADMDSRLKTQQAKMERLRALLAQAQTVEDLITLESAISDTQYEIDRLTGQMRGIDSRVDDATLDLVLTELSPVQTSQDREESLPERVRNGVAAAWKQFTLWLGDLVVFLSIALPYLIALAVLVLVIRFMIKRRKPK